MAGRMAAREKGRKYLRRKPPDKQFVLACYPVRINGDCAETINIALVDTVLSWPFTSSERSHHYAQSP